MQTYEKTETARDFYNPLNRARQNFIHNILKCLYQLPGWQNRNSYAIF